MNTVDIEVSLETTADFAYRPRQKDSFTDGNWQPGDASEVTNIKVYAYVTLQSLKDALERAIAFTKTSSNPTVPIDIWAGLSDKEQAAVEEHCFDSLNEPTSAYDN
jgi:hypothetical protein